MFALQKTISGLCRKFLPGKPAVSKTNEFLEKVEAKLFSMDAKNLLVPGDLPVTHHFAPSIYMREGFLPAGAWILGHEHKTEHFNIMLTGSMVVHTGGAWQALKAPCVLVSKPGDRKLAFIFEDTRWLTVHPTKETDIPALEKKLFVESKVFKENIQRIKTSSSRALLEA